MKSSRNRNRKQRTEQWGKKDKNKIEHFVKLAMSVLRVTIYGIALLSEVHGSEIIMNEAKNGKKEIRKWGARNGLQLNERIKSGIPEKKQWTREIYTKACECCCWSWWCVHIMSNDYNYIYCNFQLICYDYNWIKCTTKMAEKRCTNMWLLNGDK